MDRDSFDRLVDEAVAGLPAEFKRHLENIEIAVRDTPPSEILERTGVRRGGLLLGVYIGTPRPFKHPHSTVLSMPDRIELYQNNIEVVCSTPEEIKRQVQATVKHEIGHYFGMSERDLRRI